MTITFGVMPEDWSSLTECWVGLDLCSSDRKVWHQRYVDIQAVAGADFVADLTNGFEEGLAFDIADGAAISVMTTSALVAVATL